MTNVSNNVYASRKKKRGRGRRKGKRKRREREGRGKEDREIQNNSRIRNITELPTLTTLKQCMFKEALQLQTVSFG